MNILSPQLQAELEWGKTNIFFPAFSFHRESNLLTRHVIQCRCIPSCFFNYYCQYLWVFHFTWRSHWKHIFTNLQGGQIDISVLVRCIGRVICWDRSRETICNVLRSGHTYGIHRQHISLELHLMLPITMKVRAGNALLPTAFAR